MSDDKLLRGTAVREDFLNRSYNNTYYTAEKLAVSNIPINHLFPPLRTGRLWERL